MRPQHKYSNFFKINTIVRSEYSFDDYTIIDWDERKLYRNDDELLKGYWELVEDYDKDGRIYDFIIEELDIDIGECTKAEVQKIIDDNDYAYLLWVWKNFQAYIADCEMVDC